MLLFVFVFKQKTAYEMRISDWSSYVCSSDLRAIAAVARTRRNGLLGKTHRLADLAILERFARVIGRFGGGLRLAEIVRRRIRHLVHAATEIGHASCRERVCQSV